MSEGSLKKAGPILDLLSSYSNDPVAVSFRLKAFFNQVVRNSGSGFGRVKDMQNNLENIILVLLMQKYQQEKLLLVKKNIFKQKKMVLHLLIEINQHYILQ